MRPMTRAAAAVSAGLLLIGGAGTLSFWTDTESADGIELATGEITMTDIACGVGGDNLWRFADGETLVDGEQLVPGDVLTKSCSFEVTLEGDNAVAALAVTSPLTYVEMNDFTAQLAATADYSIGGEAVPATLTPADDGSTVDVELAVTFTDLGNPAEAVDPADPLQNQNLTNGADLRATLDAVTFTLTQQV